MDWAAIISSLVALLVYCNTWDSGFVYDDNRAILTNDDVLPQTPLLDLLLHDFWGTPLEHSGSHGSYRPLTVLSFRLNVAMAGGRAPRGFHVFNTLLHAGVTAAFTHWVHTISPHRLTPWISGLLFAVHPVHTEAVAGVVGRADVGAALFFVLSLLAYHEHVVRSDNKHLLVSLLLGACAMFTKEQGITVLAICVIYHLLIYASTISSQRNLKKESRCIQSVIALVTCTICLLSLRTWLTGGNFPTFAAADNPASRSESFLTRTLSFLYLPVFNFCLLLCPSVLSFDWSMDAIPLIVSIFDFRNIITTMFYSAFMWCIRNTLKNYNKVLRRRKQDLFERAAVDVNFNLSYKNQHSMQTSHPTRTKYQFYNHILSVISTCLCKTLFLKSFNTAVQNQTKDVNLYQCDNSDMKHKNFAINTRESIGKRHGSVVVLLSVSIMVIPFIPASNLVAYVGFVVAERILYIPSLGFCLLFGHGFSVVLDRISKKSPRKVNVLYILLVIMLIAHSLKTVTRNLDWRTEESLYRSGIDINPAKAYGNLGNVLSMKGQYEEAEACYRKALQYRPNMADVHYNLGVLLQSHQRFDEAIFRYHVAIQCRPRLAVAHLNLGLVLGRLGRLPEAKTVLRRCSGLDGKGLRDLRTHQAARVACLFHLGRLAMEQGQLQEAVDVFLEAVHNRPHFYAPQSLFNMLGEAYSRLGRDAEAEPWFQASLSTRPDHIPAHLTYGKLLARNRTRIGEAEDWYMRAERLAPSDAAVYRHYGQFLLSQKRYGEAVAKLEHAIALSSAPEYEDVVSTATSLRLAGDLNSAEKYYKLAISLRPQEPSSFANLGALYHLTGRLEEAEDYYKQALKILPDDDVTKMNLKRLHNLKVTQQEKMVSKEDSKS